MISEFGFRAMDSGLPNTDGAGPVVTTQSQRAGGFRRYITALVQVPYVIGYHVFAWVDDPASGNGWGENSNYGLVHLDDDPYDLVVEMFTDLHGNSTSNVTGMHARALSRPHAPAHLGAGSAVAPAIGTGELRQVARNPRRSTSAHTI
jgi:hypothetical protein